MKKKTLKKNSSNRKPISYSTDMNSNINLNNFVRKLCPAMINVFQDIPCIYLNENIQREERGEEGRGGMGRDGEGRGSLFKLMVSKQNYRQTDRVSCRGAFAPKKEVRLHEQFKLRDFITVTNLLEIATTAII